MIYEPVGTKTVPITIKQPQEFTMKSSPKYFIIFVLLFVTYFLSAQVSERKFMLMVSEQPFLQVDVFDKETDERMMGAAVFLSYNGDTLKMVTNQAGKATFVKYPFARADSVVLDISYLGYKKITHKLKVRPVVALDVRIEEDPQQINAIVVKGDNIAMVRHGDTTIYNASAFATMEGAKLADLLKKLPGVTVSDSGVSAYGEKVSKILINGTMLFDSNVLAAMEMVQSSEVQKVRVYDEHSQDRLVEKDTLGRKERVMDVRTKKQMTKAQELVLLALGGVYVDNSADIGAAIGGVEENWRSFATGQPSWMVNAGAGHNYNLSGLNNSVVTSPEDQIYADFKVSQTKPLKSSMFHSVNVVLYESDNTLDAQNIYNPTPVFDSRKEIEHSMTTNGRISASYNGSQSFTIKKNTTVGFRLKFNYDRNKSDEIFDFISEMDGIKSVMNRKSNLLSGNYIAGAGFEVSHFFKKEGRKLSSEINYDFSHGRGDASRIDTMRTATSPQWLTIGSNNNDNDFGFKVSYEEPLIGKNFRLNAAYALTGVFSKTKKLAFDELLQKNDIVNTQDFTHRDIRNELKAGLKWSTDDRILDIDADVSYVRSQQMRDEFFPENANQNGVYEQVSPGLMLNYRNRGINLSVRYTERLSIPTVEQTRGVIDNKSSLNLRAGNPNLKASTIRMVNMSFSRASAQSASVLNLGIGFSSASNSIVNKRQYFTAETYLPEYDYTAPAGSSLISPVNERGDMKFSVNTGWDTYSNALNSSFMLNLSYEIGRKPFVTGNLVQDNLGHNLGLYVSYISAFSKYFDLTIDTDLSLGRELMDRVRFYDSLNWRLSVDAKVNFLKHFFLGTKFNCNMYRTTLSGVAYDDFRWDADLTYKFGKNKSSEFILSCQDILDKSMNIMNMVLDNYHRTTEMSVFGRSLILTYKFTFR